MSVGAVPSADPADGNMMNFVGDGALPSLLQGAGQSAAAGGGIPTPIGVGERGEAAYGYGFTLPPARLAPTVGVSYASSAGPGRETAQGWSLSGVAEIALARGPAFAGLGYFTLSGPAGNGLLVPGVVPGSYVLQGAAAPVTATLDEAARVWTLKAGGTEMTLSPVLGGGYDLWRVTRTADPWGNEITHSYTAAGRLATITYGGNATLGAPPVVRVTLSYAPLGNPTYSNQHGLLELFDQALAEILVDTDPGGSGTWNRVYEYELVVTPRHERDVLDRINIRRSGGGRLTVADFTYAFWEDLSGGRASGPLWATPRTCSYSKLWKDAVWDIEPVGMSYTDCLLIDVNRDGLPDMLYGGRSDYTPDPTKTFAAAASDWHVQRMVLDVDGNYFFEPDLTPWNGPASAPGETVVEGELSQPQTVQTIALTQDVDGDGYPDLIRAEKTQDWQVYYGTHLGFAPVATTESSPWLTAGISIAADANRFPEHTESIRRTLIDLNGDGWLDLFEPGLGTYHPHTGVRGGGWSSQAVSALPDGGTLGPFRSVAYTTRPNPVQLASLMYDAASAQKVIDETSETGGFYDLNADGYVDYVIAATTPWLVRFGGPAGFAASLAEWQSPLPYVTRAKEGFPQTAYQELNDPNPHVYPEEPGYTFQTLMDVDGDRLPDLVTGQGAGQLWYHNDGTGFTSLGRATPAWWSPQFTLASTQNLDAGAVDRRSGGFSESLGGQNEQLRDLDADGKPDALAADGTATFSHSTRSYLLVRVLEPNGRQTDISYRSSSRSAPVGNPTRLQSTPSHRTLVHQVTVTDRSTGQSGRTEYLFEDGVVDRGEILGFQGRTVITEVNGLKTREDRTRYDLESGFSPAAIEQSVLYDRNLCDIPSLAVGGEDCESAFVEMWQLSTDYAHFGDQAQYKLPVTRTTRENGESSGTAVTVQRLDYGPDGELLRLEHDGGGVPADAYRAEAQYAKNPDRALVVRSRPRLLTSDRRVLEENRYHYDGRTDGSVDQGFLTLRQQCLAPVFSAGSQCAQWADTRIAAGPRGEMTSLVQPTGKREAYRYTFGQAVLRSLTNGLGHNSSRTVDNRGRIVTETSPGSLQVRTTYDDLDRVTEIALRGAGGGAFVPHKRVTYEDDSFPNWVRTESFGKGGVDAYVDLDASGRTIRTWRSSPEGLGYIRQDFLTDVRGLTIASAYPVPEQPVHDPALPADFSRLLAMRWFDGLARERESYSDFDNGLGHVRQRMALPRVSAVIDDDGFETETTRNAHGRIVEVRGGRNGALDLQATYAWDPPARLRAYTTAMGDQFLYEYDTADRLRSVRKGVVGGAPSSWYSYAYQGAKPYQVRDNTGKLVRFTFDSIMRLTAYTVSDPIGAGGSVTYRIEYDTQFPGRAALREDPRGTEKLEYDAAGQAVLRERTWTAGAAPLVRTLEYQHAATGELTGIRSPTGTVVSLDYVGGLLTAKTVTDPVNQLPLPIYYGYSPDFLHLERIRAWEMQFDLNRLRSPTRVDELRYDFNGIPSGISLDYFGNGLLRSKTHTGALLFTGGSQVYAYTDDRQVASVLRLPGTPVFEASYHPDGSLDTYRNASGTQHQYVYPATGSAAANQGLRKPLARAAGGVTTDRYRYDAAGRRTAWTTGGLTYEYDYDGLGRLRRVRSGGLDLLVYHYDAAGAVTEEVGPGGSVYRLGSWRLNAGSGREEEDIAGVLTGLYTPAPGGGSYQRLWKFPDLDGHVAATFLENLIVASTRTLSPFGEQLLATGSPWSHEAFHGLRQNDSVRLLQAGARTLPVQDGHFLQPEPLLYTGVHRGDLARPHHLAAYRYAGNDPLGYTDPTGLSSRTFDESELPVGNPSFDPDNPPSDEFAGRSWEGEEPGVDDGRPKVLTDPKLEARTELVKVLNQVEERGGIHPANLDERLAWSVAEGRDNLLSGKRSAHGFGVMGAYEIDAAKETLDLARDVGDPALIARAEDALTDQIFRAWASVNTLRGAAALGRPMAIAFLRGMASAGFEAAAAAVADLALPGAGLAVDAATTVRDAGDMTGAAGSGGTFFLMITILPEQIPVLAPAGPTSNRVY